MRANSRLSFTKLSVLLSLLPLTTLAKTNNWAKPCLQGECFYDLPDAPNAFVSGSLRIWGSPGAISDVTEAAGWAILGCDENAMAQDIRLVCMSDDNSETGCDHLYQNGGPVNKIVRLPENCGANAFARVSKSWVSEDQRIPAHVARRLIRRNMMATPEVKALALDTNFAEIDASANGEVNVALQGATVPGFNGNLTVTEPTARRRRRGAQSSKRGLFDNVKKAFKEFNSFDQNFVKDLPPINLEDNFNLLSQSVKCGAFSATVNADAKLKATAHIALGVVAVGTIAPPEFSEFGLFAGIVSAQLDGQLDIKAFAAGTADTGKLTLFQQGIPGLDFPGIITLGPSFKILAQATAKVDVGVEAVIDVSYTVKDAKLFFPPIEGSKSGGSFVPAQQPLKLSVTPSVFSDASLTVHLIPRIEVGVSALNGAAKATVFLDLDNSATLGLGLKAAPAAASAGAGVSGCVDAGLEFDVNAGADASLFGLFDKGTSVNLFQKKFPLSDKCFGQKTRRETRATRSRPFDSRSLYSREVTCPGSSLQENLVPVDV